MGTQCPAGLQVYDVAVARLLFELPQIRTVLADVHIY